MERGSAMDEKINLEGIEQRAWRESMQDGLEMVMIGVVLLGASTTFFSSSATIFTTIFPLIMAMPIIEAVRRRYTYPRTGYVKVQTDDAKMTVKGIFLYGVVVVAVIAVALYVIFGSGLWPPYVFYQVVPAFVGAMLLGAMIYTRSKSGDPRYHVYGLIALAGGIAFSIHRFAPVHSGITLYLLFIGGAFLIFGLVQFATFLREHPLPVGDGLDEGE
jgi:peptidoglycan/LPS O-acetylase OafA/YrhL